MLSFSIHTASYVPAMWHFGEFPLGQTLYNANPCILGRALKGSVGLGYFTLGQTLFNANPLILGRALKGRVGTRVSPPPFLRFVEGATVPAKLFSTWTPHRKLLPT